MSQSVRGYSNEHSGERIVDGPSRTSMLSYYLPETSRPSAYDAEYKQPPVLGSDASLSPLSMNSRGYSNDRNFDTVGPKTSTMLDWFGAERSNPDVIFTNDEYQNPLSALASSQGSPTARSNANEGYGSSSTYSVSGSSAAEGAGMGG